MKFIIISSLFIFALGCGVKGDPLPPDKPVPIGNNRVPKNIKKRRGMSTQPQQPKNEDSDAGEQDE